MEDLKVVILGIIGAGAFLAIGLAAIHALLPLPKEAKPAPSPLSSEELKLAREIALGSLRDLPG